MFEPKDRVRYEKNQIVNVVCQLRFPTILAISAREPAEFQEAVRGDYPVYQRRMERPAAAPGAAQSTGETPNYAFRTASGDCAINLTNQFLAVSAPRYTDWEAFAHRLDRAAAELPGCAQELGELARCLDQLYFGGGAPAFSPARASALRRALRLASRPPERPARH